MRDNRITIMILGRPGEAVRRLSIPRALAAGASLAFSVLFLTAVLGGIVTVRQMATQGRLAGLKAENSALQTQLDRLEASLADVRREMARQIEVGNALRTMADLEPLDEDVWKMGVGGRDPDGSDPLSGIGGSERGRVDQAGMSVDELLRQARLQREIYREVEQAVVAQRSRWDHTPSVVPVKGARLMSGFGRRTDPFTGERRMHTGVDFTCPQGQRVQATAGGTVRYAGPYESYGLMVEIEHGHGLATRYAHNSVIKVKVGQEVKRGDVIALSGKTGRATAPHCHYEVLLNGTPVDPRKYILPDGICVD